MTLDHEHQREMLLQLINAATVPGAHVERVASLKAAVQMASVTRAPERPGDRGDAKSAPTKAK